MKRLVIGGASLALVSAMAVLALPGAAAGAAASAPEPDPRTSPGARPNADARGAAARAAARLVASRPAMFKASSHDRFLAGEVLSSLGLMYVPYERTYKGLPVIGGDFVVSTDSEGLVLATSVAQTRRTRVSNVRPTVTKAEARLVAKRGVTQAKARKTRLVVLQQRRSTLAWETWVTGRQQGQPTRQAVYVGARNGRLLAAKEHVLSGTGNGNWEGSNLALPTIKTGSTFRLTNSSASTLTCQNAATNGTFTGSDDLWGNGVGTSRETGCVDAFYSAEQMRQMMGSWLGRSGMNGLGRWVPIRVGLQDQNAYYDGTQIQIGFNTVGQWIGSLDIVGHEFGHGVDHTTPGGISAAGTQEFIADTLGTTTEWYANNPADDPDFLIGEEVNLVGTGPIRNMSNPSLEGHPNCYSNAIPTMQVHAAAGPGDHWFYLLAMGSNPTNGQPTSPTCNGSTVTGIGVQTAEQILYNAMLMKTTSSSYLKYRTWTLTAAKNLFPGSCVQFNTVKAAWDAVSVPGQPDDPTCTIGTPVTVAHPGDQTGTVGTAISPFTVTASGGTPPYTWSATGLPPGITIGASTGTVEGTPTTAGTYNVNVTATDSDLGSGSASFTFTVTGGGGCAAPGELLGNPGFETGTPDPWVASAGVIDNSPEQAPRSGSWKAWLNGEGVVNTDSLTQTVNVPAGCAVTFSFWWDVVSDETTTTLKNDKLTVKANNTALVTYSNLNKNAVGYQLRSFYLTAYAGTTVKLSFTGVENGSLQTSFLIDDVSLVAGSP